MEPHVYTFTPVLSSALTKAKRGGYEQACLFTRRVPAALLPRPQGGDETLMQPFYQGKIDTFCAVYAVLNALQILHDISPAQGRELFNQVLIRESRDEERFLNILTRRTDYLGLVDRMLEGVRFRYPLKIHAPFAPGTPHSEVWAALEEYARPDLRRTVVFRFLRCVPERPRPVVDHWTTARSVDESGLHLFDCSLEPGGVYCLRGTELADALAPIAREYFVIPPECVRLLSLP